MGLTPLGIQRQHIIANSIPAKTLRRCKSSITQVFAQSPICDNALDKLRCLIVLIAIKQQAVFPILEIGSVALIGKNNGSAARGYHLKGRIGKAFQHTCF